PARPGAVPDGYRRTLCYRAGVTVTGWPGWRHTCFASRVRDLVVQQVSGTIPWAAVVEVDAGLPGAPAGLAVAVQARSHSLSDAVIETTVAYPASGRPGGKAREGNGGYVAVTRVTVAPASGRVRLAGDHAVRVTGCRELTVFTRVEAFRD